MSEKPANVRPSLDGAYRELESDICDIKHMASIAAHEACDDRDIDDQTQFAVFHLQKMINDFHARYVAMYREGGQ